jgi:hypothetical protein
MDSKATRVSGYVNKVRFPSIIILLVGTSRANEKILAKCMFIYIYHKVYKLSFKNKIDSNRGIYIVSIL